MVYNEENVTYSTFIYKDKSRKYLVIGSSSTLSDEYRILDANTPEGQFKVFQPRQKGLQYSIAYNNDRFYIRTNYHAVNFRLMETMIDKTGIENWKEVIAHREDVLLEEFDVFNGYLAIQERKDGMKTLRIFNSSDLDFYLEFNEQAYTVTLGENAELETDIVRYNYTSLTTPMSVFDYNVKTKKSELRKRQEVIGGYNPDDYFTERLIAIAEDGAKIPISMVYKKKLEKTGKSLCCFTLMVLTVTVQILISIQSGFCCDRGFIYAIAHVRGGEEMGRQWYEDGKLLKKKNTFTDFIACAEYLVKQNYTTPDHLYALGGSAGGLLVGAVVNMRPDLFMESSRRYHLWMS